jgi:hypothetical protein
MATLPELIAHIRANPGRVNYASSGTGSQLHLTGEMFRAAVGVEMTHVPYRGSAPAMTDLVAGNVPMMFDGLGTALPQVRGGAVRCLGVASDRENAALPGVPPIASALPGFLSVNWTGLFALRGTPEPVVARIDAETRRALAGPEMATLFRARAFDPMPIRARNCRPSWRRRARGGGKRCALRGRAPNEGGGGEPPPISARYWVPRAFRPSAGVEGAAPPRLLPAPARTAAGSSCPPAAAA